MTKSAERNCSNVLILRFGAPALPSFIYSSLFPSSSIIPPASISVLALSAPCTLHHRPCLPYPNITSASTTCALHASGQTSQNLITTTTYHARWRLSVKNPALDAKPFPWIPVVNPCLTKLPSVAEAEAEVTGEHASESIVRMRKGRVDELFADLAWRCAFASLYALD